MSEMTRESDDSLTHPQERHLRGWPENLPGKYGQCTMAMETPLGQTREKV